jgi:hypothetical protein
MGGDRCLILSPSLRHITLLKRLETRISTAVSEDMQSICHTLDTISGFGVIFSAGTITETGDVAHFDYNQAKVAKYAGFKWPKICTADYQADERRRPATATATCVI